MTNQTAAAPAPGSLTRAPLRNRLTADLTATPDQVWALMGDFTRYPEYSAGIERAEVSLATDGRCSSYVCYFRPMDGEAEGIAHREVMRWYEPGVGYASQGEEPNAFGLRGSITLLTLAPTPGGTTLTWSQHYDADDLATAKAVFDEALEDIGANLVARFGGRVTERFVQE